uniref:Uncharacterized protein n=1 Tax=Rhizophora mucronata TaxID=61149 RepID=A0A2P2KWN3_RHIMU
MQRDVYIANFNAILRLIFFFFQLVRKLSCLLRSARVRRGAAETRLISDVSVDSYW